MSRVLVIGELNPDLVLNNYSSFPEPGKEVLVDDCTLTLGSASAICAMALARLGDQVGFVSKVGCDPYGDFSTGILARAGIDVTRVERDPAVKTGITVSISSSRDRALITYLGAIGLYDGSNLDAAALAGYDHLHMSSYYLQAGLQPHVAALLRAATQHGLTTSLDPGCDPSGRWDGRLRETLLEVDLFLPNEVELSALAGDEDPERAIAALGNGRTLVVAKLGSRGCLAGSGGRVVRQGPFPVEPVDTTGAGDTCNAGFLHAWLGRQPLDQCLRFAAACGALSTLAPGGIGHQPTEAEALEFMGAHSAAVFA
jgi:sugar/nucleoside kinase (ribokinase family)